MRLRTLVAAAVAVSAHAAVAVPNADAKIVFSRLCGSSCGDIYAVEPDGRGLARLTRTRNNFAPALSPDGTKIAFASDRGRAGAPEIYVMNADGTGVRRLTRTVNFPRNFRASFAPVWSPDGTRIAFEMLSARGARSNVDVYVVRATGGGLTRLTYHAANDARATWSPDGTKIAFTSDRTGRPELFVMDAAGHGERRLTNVGLGDPDWSPDGTRLAAVGEKGIYVVAADGSTATLLPGTARDSDPTWSPDGSRLAFVSARQPDAGAAVYTMNADGTNRTRVTRPGQLRNDVAPDWE